LAAATGVEEGGTRRGGGGSGEAGRARFGSETAARVGRKRRRWVCALGLVGFGLGVLSGGWGGVGGVVATRVGAGLGFMARVDRIGFDA
jgi:hypothetical protein